MRFSASMPQRLGVSVRRSMSGLWRAVSAEFRLIHAWMRLRAFHPLRLPAPIPACPQLAAAAYATPPLWPRQVGRVNRNSPCAPWLEKRKCYTTSGAVNRPGR